MKLSFRVVVAVASCLLTVGSFAAAQTVSFTRSLTIGASGEDVRLLQQILNSDVRTRIAATGPGSPGQETTLFGGLTRAAVIRFQELYASEVLAPAGLTRGTGFVGSMSIKKLNTLSSQTSTTAGPSIISLSPARANIRGTVVVTGIGFEAPPVAVIIDGSKAVIPGLNPEDATRLSFIVPDGLAAGFHTVIVTTANGASNALKLRVEDSGTAIPSSGFYVGQLSPSRGGYGTTVTILGNGFLPTGNTVTFGFHTFTNVASADGKTLVVQIPTQFTGLIFNPEEIAGAEPELPLGVMVTNTSGESNVGVFTFTFYN